MRFRFDMYLAGETPVSRCDPRVKIALLAVFSIAVLVVRSWWGLALLACILVGVLALARIPLGKINRALAFVYAIAAISFAFNVIAQPNAAGVLSGLNVAIRMVVLVAGSFAVCFTTPATQLVDALRSIMCPLRILHAPTDDIAVTLSLALRFVPVIGEELQRVRTAQIVRGAGLHTGAMQRIRMWGVTFTSVFVGLFRRADALATAMDARCYGAARKRSSMRQMRMSGMSALALIVGVAVLVGACVFL